MAVCSQNLTLGALSNSSAFSMLVGALFKNFSLFLNTPCRINQMPKGKGKFQPRTGHVPGVGPDGKLGCDLLCL
jgi:hypothetical protein